MAETVLYWISALAGMTTGCCTWLKCYQNLNPIELAFSKIKQRLRTQAYRTVDSLWQCMQAVLDAISQPDAANFLKHRSYTLHLN